MATRARVVVIRYAQLSVLSTGPHATPLSTNINISISKLMWLPKMIYLITHPWPALTYPCPTGRRDFPWNPCTTPRVMITKICPSPIVTPPQTTISSMVYQARAVACAVARLLTTPPARFTQSRIPPSLRHPPHPRSTHPPRTRPSPVIRLQVSMTSYNGIR